MAPQSKEPAESKTLPRPEVNPLLNPLLGQNMGRWAEVYFTNPPEKREEAVLHLLRELEAEDSSGAAAAPVWDAEHSVEEHSIPSDLLPGISPYQEEPMEMQPASVRCANCDRDNPADHHFCGECGTRLIPSARSVEDLVSTIPGAQEAEAPLEHLIHEGSNGADGDSAEELLAAGVGANSGNAEEWRASDDAMLAHSEKTGEGELHGRWSGLNSFAPQEATPDRSYRIYVVMAAVFVVLVVGYTVWRATRTSQASQTKLIYPVNGEPKAQAAVPAIAPQNPAGPAAQIPPLSASPAQANPDTQPEMLSEPKTESRPNTGTAGRENETLQKAPSKSAAATPLKSSVAPNRTPVAASGAGNEELTTARELLNGSNGHPHDPALAVQWLWKAIEKKNAEASVLLADLYLKGDGVAKNCDQARVLLDAAASKGTPGAGERLRNLQAFGCQ